MKRMKNAGRTLSGGLLGLFLILGMTAPLAFTSCESPQSDINIKLEKNYSAIIEAINQSSRSLSDKLALIEAAIVDGFADNQKALALIQQAVETLGGSMSEKMADIEAAVKARPRVWKQSWH